MRRGNVWRAPRPRPLLPEPLHVAGAVLLAACVAAALAAFAAGRGNPGRLDSALDPRIQAWLGRFPALLDWLPRLGGLKEVALMTAALGLACVATRRWSGAVLVLVAVPAAIGLTEYVLKPYVGTIINQAFPSGHSTSSFALAGTFAILIADPLYRRLPGPLRLLLVLLAQLVAASVAAAMIAMGAHTFTDAVGGAAVGTGVVLACALALDLAVRWAGGPPDPRPARGGGGPLAAPANLPAAPANLPAAPANLPAAPANLPATPVTRPPDAASRQA